MKLIFISPGDLVDIGAVTSRPHAMLKNENIKIDYGFIKSEEYKFKESTSFFRGKSIILGYLYRILKLLKENKYKQILFGKFALTGNENRAKNSLEKKRESLSVLTKEIILKLRDEGCIFVLHSETRTNEYDYLLQEMKEFSEVNEVALINLTPLFDKLKLSGINYQYWPVTNKFGHFNEIGHNEIADFLYMSLIESKRVSVDPN